MIQELRKKISNSKRIVIKIGTNVLTGKTGRLTAESMQNLVDQIAHLKNHLKKEIIIVSSGAIGAGMGEMDIKKRPKAMPDLQALASVGQCLLMKRYHEMFREKGITIGQVLLTMDDIRNRKRHLNTSHALNALLSKGVIPVINENDTVAVDEIRFGDNDILAAMVSMMTRANLLVILSTVDGFFDYKNEMVIEYIFDVDESLMKNVRPEKSELGTGGMSSKIKAVEKVMNVGEIAVIANGRKKDSLLRIAEGKSEGTVFYSEKRSRLDAKKRWIAFFTEVHGRLCIDKGATRALIEKNRSLLPAGITKVEGDFKEGSIVSIIGDGNREIGRGLVNYSSKDIEKICGCQTCDISGILGHGSGEEVVHKDNLVVFAVKGWEDR